MTQPANQATPGGWTAPAWDAAVRAQPRPTYLQATAWARVKAPNGWRPRLVVAGEPSEVDQVIGAQLLVRDLPVVPWRLGYAPRGPIAASWTPEAVDRWTDLLRSARSLDDLAVVRMDPEVEAGDAAPGVVARLRERGWRRTRDVQPHSTRIVDLEPEEPALWSDLRKKWRQYVNRACDGGVTVREVDQAAEPDAFDRFGEVMRVTSARARIPIRATSAYRDLWSAFRPGNESRMLVAEHADGRVLAVLLVIHCGARVTEPYGGMTDEGAELRANYLLKWEAIRRSREWGATEYDLWGLPTPGIAHFKEGFGGREVQYIGAWDLPRSAVGSVVVRVGESARRVARRALRGRTDAAAEGPA